MAKQCNRLNYTYAGRCSCIIQMNFAQYFEASPGMINESFGKFLLYILDCLKATGAIA